MNPFKDRMPALACLSEFCHGRFRRMPSIRLNGRADLDRTSLEQLFPFLGAKDHVAYSLFPSVDRLETPFVQHLSREIEKNDDYRPNILTKTCTVNPHNKNNVQVYYLKKEQS